MCVYFMPSQNMPIWCMEYFELVIFKEQQTQGKFLFCQRNTHLYRKSPCVRMCSSPYQEKQDDQIPRNLSTEKGQDLNLHNNLTFVYLVHNNIPKLSLFRLQLKMVCKVVPWAISESQLLSVPGYAPCIQEVYGVINSMKQE